MRMRQLASKIVKHEDKFDMYGWFDIDQDVTMTIKEVIDKILEKRRPICGTSGCAAGWAVLMFGTKKQIRGCIEDDGDWAEVAQELLGMTNAETDLFGQTESTAREIASDLLQMAAA
jgi:hypothetical protein